jgi:predicted esterase
VERDGRTRFAATRDDGALAAVVDLLGPPDAARGVEGAGIVHHIAFRVPDAEAQEALRRRIAAAGHRVTPILDRQYFRSIYFREPNGVLFEVASDPPGFAVDEPAGDDGRAPDAARLAGDAARPDRTRAAAPAARQRLRGGDGMSALDAFVHRFLPGAVGEERSLLVLHGTGGDEADLLPLAGQLLPGAALLSPRGQVLEGGMPRFFRRFAEGVLDRDDLVARARGLADFVEAAAARHGLDRSRMFALGYSNGANIAAAMLLLRPGTVAGALLLRPMMLPIAPEDAAGGLAGAPVRIVAGGRDPIVPPGDPERLAGALRAAGATVEVAVHQAAGHGPLPAELAAASEWLGGQQRRAAA